MRQYQCCSDGFWKTYDWLLIPGEEKEKKPQEKTMLSRISIDIIVSIVTKMSQRNHSLSAKEGYRDIVTSILF